MSSRIEANARVVLDYTLRDDHDDILDTSDAEDGEPIVYVHGYGMLVPGLEKALMGLVAGDQCTIVVSPEEGFGEHDEELVMEIDRSEMPRPDAACVGDEIVAESAEGDETVMRVIEVKPDSVVLDGNHPLAGQRLHYSVIVREVRAATDQEIEEAASEFEEASEGFEPKKKPNGNGHGGGDLVELRRSRGASPKRN